MKVSWINKKTTSFKNIENILQESYDKGQLTNGGPVVTRLETFFQSLLDINSDYRVIAVANGALGLHSLVNGINCFYDPEHERKFKYATQAFTFPCSAQGPCEGSFIIDLNSETLSIDLSKIPTNFIDGLIVTNLFGNVGPLDKIIEWSQKNQKILIFDNATTPLTFYSCEDGAMKRMKNNVNNFGDGSIISLHHTKILGMGEGGLIIVKKEYEKCVRRCINFDFSDDRLHWGPWGNNAKMSEISAAFILDYILGNWEAIITHAKILYKLFSQKIKDIPRVKIFPNYGTGIPFVSCLALVFDRNIGESELNLFQDEGITAKKYYAPLKDLPVSTDLFQRILCLPCHLDVTEDTLNNYIEIIKRITTSGKGIHIDTFTVEDNK